MLVIDRDIKGGKTTKLFYRAMVYCQEGRNVIFVCPTRERAKITLQEMSVHIPTNLKNQLYKEPSSLIINKNYISFMSFDWFLEIKDKIEKGTIIMIDDLDDCLFGKNRLDAITTTSYKEVKK